MAKEGARATPLRPMRIFCKDERLNAAVRGDKIILVPADPSDRSQHWYKEDHNIGKLADEEGKPAFVLVNRTTGQAAMWKGKEPKEAELQLALYNGDVAVEVPMLWSLGDELDGGFHEVRALKDISCTFNALYGAPLQGRALGTCPRGDDGGGYNSVWKIEPIKEEKKSHVDLQVD